jgi:chromate transporter
MVKHMLEGLAAAAAGLLFAMGLKMLRPILNRAMTWFTIALTFVFMLLMKVPLLLTLIILIAINLSLLSLNKGAKSA